MAVFHVIGRDVVCVRAVLPVRVILINIPNNIATITLHILIIQTVLTINVI